MTSSTNAITAGFARCSRHAATTTSFSSRAIGSLIYTVFKELDYATNLMTGEYSETDLGNAFRAALNGDGESIHFFDFKPYAPSAGAPASFISMPVRNGIETLGVLVFQMPIDNINAVMSDPSGFGETGEAIPCRFGQTVPERFE